MSSGFSTTVCSSQTQRNSIHRPTLTEIRVKKTPSIVHGSRGRGNSPDHLSVEPTSRTRERGRAIALRLSLVQRTTRARRTNHITGQSRVWNMNIRKSITHLLSLVPPHASPSRVCVCEPSGELGVFPALSRAITQGCRAIRREERRRFIFRRSHRTRGPRRDVNESTKVERQRARRALGPAVK